MYGERRLHGWLLGSWQGFRAVGGAWIGEAVISGECAMISTRMVHAPSVTAPRNAIFPHTAYWRTPLGICVGYFCKIRLGPKEAVYEISLTTLQLLLLLLLRRVARPSPQRSTMTFSAGARESLLELKAFDTNFARHFSPCIYLPQASPGQQSACRIVQCDRSAGCSAPK